MARTGTRNTRTPRRARAGLPEQDEAVEAVDADRLDGIDRQRLEGQRRDSLPGEPLAILDRARAQGRPEREADSRTRIDHVRAGIVETQCVPHARAQLQPGMVGEGKAQTLERIDGSVRVPDRRAYGRFEDREILGAGRLEAGAHDEHAVRVVTDDPNPLLHRHLGDALPDLQ
ncbi:MAG: hypothetical protein HC927_04295 [Deltaproteobacteria bacterium]|nr:hypothetical protein [Deltaproteobacteria bacterium]